MTHLDAPRCRRCGRPFQPKVTNQVFCSESCRISYDKKLAQYNRKVFEDRVCLGCGATFTPNTSNQLFCSERCRNRTPRPTKCPVCGREFLRRKQDPRTCCIACAEEYERQEAAKRQTQKRQKAPHVATIAEIAVEAAKHGMSYGEYVASKYFKG